MSLTLSACLITNPVEFEQEESYPPFVLDFRRSASPIGSILEVNLDENPIRIDLRVQISDQNAFQDLAARSRVRTAQDPEPVFEEVELPAEGTVLREHTVFVERGLIRRGECHVVDLVVSGSFVEGDDADLFDVINDTGDIGRASWTLWEVSGDPTGEDNGAAAQALVRTCPTLDAPVEQGAEAVP